VDLFTLRGPALLLLAMVPCAIAQEAPCQCEGGYVRINVPMTMEQEVPCHHAIAERVALLVKGSGGCCRVRRSAGLPTSTAY
jgi:hypothetical protein